MNPTTPGYKTSEFYTTLISQVFGLLLAAGIITQSQVTAANSSLPIIGGFLAFVVPTVLYIATRFGLKWRFGPVPTLPSGPNMADVAPATAGPVSPSHSPPSTGSGLPPAIPDDLPSEAV